MAMKAARAVLAAESQGKFWEYHEKLFSKKTSLGRKRLREYADDAGLEMKRFEACFDDREGKDRVDADMRAGQQAGTRGTPAFFINGRFLNGAQPYEAFKKLIDEELELAGSGS